MRNHRQQSVLGPTMSANDVAVINAIQVVDPACLATVNQVGQLNVWDLRSATGPRSQRRVVP